MHKSMASFLTALLLVMSSSAQSREPIIDMHLHALPVDNQGLWVDLKSR